MELGQHDEAMAFWKWTDRLDRSDGFAVAYRADGSAVPREQILGHLSGYHEAGPVRVGNDVSNQRQLDLHGYLLDAGHQCQVLMGQPHPSLRTILEHCAAALVETWREPDRGIWEVRGAPRHFVHSRLYAWIGLCRAIDLHRRGWIAGEIDRWKQKRAAIRQAILERGWSPARQCFTQALDRTELDASALLLVARGFLAPADPRATATVETIRRELDAGRSEAPLLHRYRAEDGLPGEEGAFLLCSFWLVEALVALGRRAEAEEIFVHLLRLRNDVGLLSEEIDPGTEAFCGNFPQAFSHLGLIRAALALSEPKEGDSRTR